MDAQRFRTSIDSESLYRKLYNPRWSHTREEHTLEMKIDFERLRMEVVLSQPAPPPQCDSSPRRLPAVDTGSDEPGTPRRSPAIGTGPDEPGVSRAESWSTERDDFFSLRASVEFFARQLHESGAAVNFASTIRRSGRRQKYKYFRRRHCSRGVRNTPEEAAAAKDDSMDYRAKQAI